MEFTGERYVPNVKEIENLYYEHIVRYMFAGNFLENTNSVLDVGCGTGYGTYYLAKNYVKSIIGIDISKDSIEYAKDNYKNDNLSFKCIDATNLPFDDNVFDAVVSFEVIEHIKNYKGYLMEIKRVLKEDGILVLSTPNKLVSSPKSENPLNIFHYKEFTPFKFKDTLLEHFASVCLFMQDKLEGQIFTKNFGKFVSKKVIDRTEIAESKNEGIDSVEVDLNENDAPYLVAVCSKDNEFNPKVQSIIKNVIFIPYIFPAWKGLRDTIKERENWIDILQEEKKVRDKRISELESTIEERENWIGTLQEEKKVRNERISELESAIKGRENCIDILQEEKKVRDEKIDELEDTIKERENCINILQEEKRGRIKRISKLENIVIAEKEQVIKNQQGHVEQLLEQERALNRIQNSNGWKALLKYYKIRDWFLPQNSKRRLFAKLLIKLVCNPKKFIRYINSENMKKFFYYLKTDNTGMLDNRIDSYISKYNSEIKTEIEIYKTEEEKFYEKLILPKCKAPVVSIIIPIHNQWEYTYSCLYSILKNTEKIDYEVIIADDNSNDETINILDYIENITVIRNKTNLGFLLNCNNAAKEAKGRYILFLNNDTNVQKDWLKYLLETVEKDSSIGMVGSKFVYPDGRLQEAGGIIWKDASGWNYGRLDDPEKPEYNYKKEVDYISGACIMIRSNLWNEIGGFDERYIPAYFEDSDLAFEVRKYGYKVVLQPKSVVVHFEGISHGTDVNAGIKTYQLKNKSKFIEKWKDILERDHFENAHNVFWARDRSKYKKTILVIDHYVPHFDKDAGSRTTFQYLKLFVEMGLNVKFLGDNFYKHEPYTTELENLGIEVLYGVWYRDNYKKWIKDNADKISYVYLNRPHISIKYIDFLRENTKAKIIYYGHDLHYLRELREYEIYKNPEILKSSEKWRKVEFELIEKSDVVYYPSQIEINEIKKYYPEKNAKAITAYIFDFQKPKRIRPIKDTKDLLFVGGFSHKPNVDGVLWFVNEIYPLILNKLPDIKFYVVGSNPPDVIKNLQSSNIKVTGFVTEEELDSYYKRCRLAVVPLRYGAGVKGKVVEAIYYQIPIVTTPIGSEGLCDVENIITIANNPEDYAAKVFDLYNSISALCSISAKSIRYIIDNFSSNNAIEIISADIR